MMSRYRGKRLVRSGFIGIVLAVLIVAVGLQPERLWSMATQLDYQAVFVEAGGLITGNKVRVSGVEVGSVTAIGLQGLEALVTFKVDGKVRLGSDTTAHITTGTLLGERVLVLDPSGTNSLSPGDIIPVSKTSSPYSLTDAVGELTRNTSATDTAALNQSLDTLSTTIDQIAPKVAPMFDGLTRLSRTLNRRDKTLDQLLADTADVTGILSERSQQVNRLILNANDLLEVLVERRQAIVDLLGNTSVVADQLSGLVQDNRDELAPTLDRLNSVTEVLERNKDSIAEALPALAKYQITLGETVSSGFYYNGYVPNLVMGQILQPFYDYAFGFRAGDPNMPRALLPFPRNGNPPGHR